MLEPTVQDYIQAFAQMDRSTFCERIGVPVLITRAARERLVFQLATTDMLPLERLEDGPRRRGGLQGGQPVIELRKPTGSSGQFMVGRAEENDLVISDETVSSRHAALFRDRSGKMVVQDLDSTNGTSINGTLLVPARAVELHDGDVVAFGDAEYIFFSPGGLYDEIGRSIPSPMER